MNLSDCFYLGYISRVWSNSNKLTIKLDTDRPEEYTKKESVLIQLHKQDQSPVPFFIQRIHSLKDKELTLELNFGNMIPDISILKGTSVYLPLSELPPLKNKQFYYHEVIGYTVIDKEKGDIGRIEEVIENTANPLLSIKKDDVEILIPINDDIIEKLDRENQKMFVAAPAGLIDMYLEI